MKDSAPGYGEDERSTKAERGQTYRTVCVRLCDGYYWPISYSAPKSRLYRDANACQASCAGEAKLFHYPSAGGTIDEAVDQTGRPYVRLTNAFRYRKTLVEGCACKPEPWSETEMIRHERYALEEKAAGQSAKATATSSSDGADRIAAAGGPGVPARTAAGEASGTASPVASSVETGEEANQAGRRKPEVVRIEPVRSRPTRAAETAPATFAQRRSAPLRGQPLSASHRAPTAQQPQRTPRVAAPYPWGAAPPPYGWSGNPPVRYQ